MKRTQPHEIIWLNLDWQRPFKLEAVTDMLTHLASHVPQTEIIFEARGSQGKVRYYLGANQQYIRILADAMKAHGNIRFTSVSPNARIPVNEARWLKISKPILSLKTDMTEAVIRAGLAALLQAKGQEQAVLQVVLSKPSSPTPMPNTLPDPHVSWFKAAFGDVQQASAESRTTIKEKLSCPNFNALIRLGATGTKQRADGLILSIISALKTLRSAGVNIWAANENADKLNNTYIPWRFPHRLSVKEVSNFLLFPIGETELPGIMGLHPKKILPPSWYYNPPRIYDRTFATSLDGKRLSISPKDSLEHTVILGPTGCGKSTAMLHQIKRDIEEGKSVMVLDPKADLNNSVMSIIPKSRIEDLVIIDPSSENPVGFNPLAHKNHPNPGLIADAILAVFQQIFSENWGIRSQDHISAGLLTLVKAKGSSLLWLPTLLTDESFRKKITAGIDDKIGLEPYWAAFENMRDSERRQEIAPVMNKIRQFLLRPGLRNILGQANPKFDLNDLFTKPRIVLVSLNKGIIGAESAKLLGSLIVGLTWTLALSRATIPEDKRRHVSVYIDELQDYISSISSDFSDALAQARGLKMALTMAHQYREQLPPEIRAGIDANARNKICFGVSAADAKAMAAMAPELEPNDFMALPRYHVYTSFNCNGRNTGWISGQTQPMPIRPNNPNALKKMVEARYCKSGKEVEQEYLALLASTQAENESEALSSPIGRKEKQ